MHETEVLESAEWQLRNKFTSLYTLGQRLASLLITTTTDVRNQIQRQQEALVKAMDRILTLALPKELEQARRFRDSVLELRDNVVDAEFDMEQLEARKRHLLKRGMSEAQLQVHSRAFVFACLDKWANVGAAEIIDSDV